MTTDNEAFEKWAEGLKTRLSYNQITGEFTWINPASRNIKAGSKAGSKNSEGYINIMYYKRIYKAHRLAWLYVYGKFPISQLDHINGTRDDNRISNLREVTNAENQQNIRSPYKNNKTGILGVHKHRDKFESQIRLNGKAKYLGLFKTEAEASEAYINAKREQHIFNTI